MTTAEIYTLSLHDALPICEEMMLQGRDPAIADWPRKEAVLLVLDVELVVGVTVVVRRPAEREGLRVPHRALVAERVTQELRIGRELDRLCAAVLDAVAQVHPVCAASERECLRHREPRAVRPSERHLE